MVRQHKACEECTQTCLLMHGQKNPDPSPIVSSFFKVMIDKSFKRVLYFPPAFARTVSHLANEETYLVDSSGQRWKVQICDRNGPLAIRQGWHRFSSDHGLEMGDFLVFHYIQGQHFVVQIYGRTGLQKISFYNETRKGKNRARTNRKATSEDELLPETDINVRKKQRSTPSITAVPESERAGHQPVISTFASNIDADTGKRQRVPEAEGIGGALQGETGPPNYVSTNSRSLRESSSIDGVLVEMELLASGSLDYLDVVAVQTENSTEPVNDVSNLGHNDENDNMGLISGTSPKSAENGGKGSQLELLYDKERHCTGDNQVTRDKANEASQFVKEPRVEKQKLKEMAEKAHCHAKKQNGKELKIIEKYSLGSPTAVSGYNKVIKSGPAESGHPLFPDTAGFSYLLRVDGRNFVELPENWPDVMGTMKKLNILVQLQGPDCKRWSVMYHESEGCKVLADGWTLFTARYGLRPGDECFFQPLDLSERVFKVDIALKIEVPPISLSEYYE